MDFDFIDKSRCYFRGIEDFKKRLDTISLAIQNKNEDVIWNFSQHGRQVRKAMEIHKRAGVDSFDDIFINVPDEEDAVLGGVGTSKGNIHCQYSH